MATKILKEFTNVETGMMSMVVENTVSGFNVVLKDMDSGECVPFVSIHKTMESAEAKAAEIVA